MSGYPLERESVAAASVAEQAAEREHEADREPGPRVQAVAALLKPGDEQAEPAGSGQQAERRAPNGLPGASHSARSPSGRVKSGPSETAPSASPKPTSAQTQNQTQPMRWSRRASIADNDRTTREATMRAAAPWPSG